MVFRLYICRICNRTFNSQRNLQLHFSQPSGRCHRATRRSHDARVHRATSAAAAAFGAGRATVRNPRPIINGSYRYTYPSFTGVEERPGDNEGTGNDNYSYGEMELDYEEGQTSRTTGLQTGRTPPTEGQMAE